MKAMNKYIFLFTLSLFVFFSSCEGDELQQPDGRLLGVEVSLQHRNPSTGELQTNVFKDKYQSNQTVEINLSSTKQMDRVEIVSSEEDEILEVLEVNGSEISYSVEVSELNVPFAQSMNLYFHVYYDDKGTDGFDYQSVQTVVFSVIHDASIVGLQKQDGTFISLATESNNVDEVYPDEDGTPVARFLGELSDPSGGELDPSYMTVQDNTLLNFGSGDFSVSFWIQSNHDDSDPALMGNMDWDSSNNTGWLIAWKNGWIRAVVTNREDENNESKTSLDLKEIGTNLLGDEWRQVIMTADRDGKLSIYVDGVLDGEMDMEVNAGQAIVSVDNGNPVNINQDGTGSYGDRLDAEFKKVVFYDYALSSSEVQSIYSLGK
jgi:hypothetical protein